MLRKWFASSSDATNTVVQDNIDAPTPNNAADIFGNSSRVFELQVDDEEVSFLVFGCQGEDSKEQIQVAKQMLAIAEKYGVHFAVTTGDNIYPHGARSPDAKAFYKYFYKHYQQFPFPVLVTLGNHDGNYAKIATYNINGYSFNLKLLNPVAAYSDISEHGIKSLTAPSTGEITEQNEVIHTYLGNTQAKIATLTQTQLTIKQLNDAELKWVMPAQYYSYFIGKMQVIHLNSNILVKDFLDYQTNPQINNQISWLLKTYQDAKQAAREIIIIQHHSLFTCGKRVYHGDQDHYLNPMQMEEIETLLGKKRINYNEMLLGIFQLLQIEPNLFLGAHDHSLYYYSNKTSPAQTYKLSQVVSGGGGGHELQDRMGFAEPSYVPIFLKQPGFCRLTFNQNHPEEIFIHYHTEKHHLVFSSKNAKPIRPINPNGQVEILRDAVLSACEDYFDFIHARQNECKGKFFSNMTHTMADINKLHEMLAYFNQHAGLPSLETTLKELKNHVMQISNQDSQHAFKVYLDAKIVTAFASNIKIVANYFNMPNLDPVQPSVRS